MHPAVSHPKTYDTLRAGCFPTEPAPVWPNVLYDGLEWHVVAAFKTSGDWCLAIRNGQRQPQTVRAAACAWKANAASGRPPTPHQAGAPTVSSERGQRSCGQ